MSQFEITHFDRLHYAKLKAWVYSTSAWGWNLRWRWIYWLETGMLEKAGIRGAIVLAFAGIVFGLLALLSIVGR